MASKVVKGAKKLTQVKVDHPPYIQTNIRSGKAVAAPPLGPMIGQRGIQISQFVKKFNDMTKDYIPGIPIPTFVKANPDRTFDITLRSPPTSYFLKKAAGMKRGSPVTMQIQGKVSLKHIYEIAKIKSNDTSFRNVPLQSICKQVIGTANTMGIEVVKHLDPVEYGEFLIASYKRDEEHEQKMEEIRQAKLLRL